MRGTKAKKLRKLAASKGSQTQALIEPHEKWIPGKDDKDGKPTEIKIVRKTMVYRGYRRIYQDLKKAKVLDERI